MLHTQGTSREKRGGPPQDRRASEWAQRSHLISPVPRRSPVQMARVVVTLLTKQVLEGQPRFAPRGQVW
jgi:hypothetical protein